MPPPKRGRAVVNVNVKRGRGKMQTPIGLPFVEDVKDEPKKEEPEELDLGKPYVAYFVSVFLKIDVSE